MSPVVATAVSACNRDGGPRAASVLAGLVLLALPTACDLPSRLHPQATSTPWASPTALPPVTEWPRRHLQFGDWPEPLGRIAMAVPPGWRGPVGSDFGSPLEFVSPCVDPGIDQSGDYCELAGRIEVEMDSGGGFPFPTTGSWQSKPAPTWTPVSAIEVGGYPATITGGATPDPGSPPSGGWDYEARVPRTIHYSIADSAPGVDQASALYTFRFSVGDFRTTYDMAAPYVAVFLEMLTTVQFVEYETWPLPLGEERWTQSTVPVPVDLVTVGSGAPSAQSYWDVFHPVGWALDTGLDGGWTISQPYPDGASGYRGEPMTITVQPATPADSIMARGLIAAYERAEYWTAAVETAPHVERDSIVLGTFGVRMPDTSAYPRQLRWVTPEWQAVAEAPGAPPGSEAFLGYESAALHILSLTTLRTVQEPTAGYPSPTLVCKLPPFC